jgi:hypothetical protein
MGFLGKYKTLIITVVLIAAGAIFYTLYLKPAGGVEILTSSGENAALAPVENDFISMLFELRAVKIDGRIFQDSIFRSLKDYSQDIKPEPVGRRNPFAPIGVDPIDATVGTSSATQ